MTALCPAVQPLPDVDVAPDRLRLGSLRPYPSRAVGLHRVDVVKYAQQTARSSDIIALCASVSRSRSPAGNPSRAKAARLEWIAGM
jgi:hypothetical protein